MKDYRIDQAKAAVMTSRQIVDGVLFAIADDAPPYSDDAAMESFFTRLNPVVAALFSAWMVSGFIANGGLFQIYETCSSGMIARAAYGFRLLGKVDVARAIELTFRAFPNSVLPDSADERQQLIEQWSERLESGEETPVDETLSGLHDSFNIMNAYERTDEVIGQYRYEFVQP